MDVVGNPRRVNVVMHDRRRHHRDGVADKVGSHAVDARTAQELQRDASAAKEFTSHVGHDGALRSIGDFLNGPHDDVGSKHMPKSRASPTRHVSPPRQGMQPVAASSSTGLGPNAVRQPGGLTSLSADALSSEVLRREHLRQLRQLGNQAQQPPAVALAEPPRRSNAQLAPIAHDPTAVARRVGWGDSDPPPEHAPGQGRRRRSSAPGTLSPLASAPVARLTTNGSGQQRMPDVTTPPPRSLTSLDHHSAVHGNRSQSVPPKRTGLLPLANTPGMQGASNQSASPLKHSFENRHPTHGSSGVAAALTRDATPRIAAAVIRPAADATPAAVSEIPILKPEEDRVNVNEGRAERRRRRKESIEGQRSASAHDSTATNQSKPNQTAEALSTQRTRAPATTTAISAGAVAGGVPRSDVDRRPPSPAPRQPTQAPQAPQPNESRGSLQERSVQRDASTSVALPDPTVPEVHHENPEGRGATSSVKREEPKSGVAVQAVPAPAAAPARTSPVRAAPKALEPTELRQTPIVAQAPPPQHHPPPPVIASPAASPIRERQREPSVPFTTVPPEALRASVIGDNVSHRHAAALRREPSLEPEASYVRLTTGQLALTGGAQLTAGLIGSASPVHGRPSRQDPGALSPAAMAAVDARAAAREAQRRVAEEQTEAAMRALRQPGPMTADAHARLAQAVYTNGTEAQRSYLNFAPGAIIVRGQSTVAAGVPLSKALLGQA